MLGFQASYVYKIRRYQTDVIIAGVPIQPAGSVCLHLSSCSSPTPGVQRVLLSPSQQETRFSSSATSSYRLVSSAATFSYRLVSSAATASYLG